MPHKHRNDPLQKEYIVTDLPTDLPDLSSPEKIPPARSPWIMLSIMTILILVLLIGSGALLYFALKKGDKLPETNFKLGQLFQKKPPAEQVESPRTDGGAEQGVAPISEKEKMATEPSQKAEEKNPPKKEKKVRWPKLKVTGFGRSTDGKGGFAIINGEHVFLNQQISKATLVEVREHDVVVELEGEQKTLTVDP